MDSHYRAPGLYLLQVLESVLGGHIFILFQLKVHSKKVKSPATIWQKCQTSQKPNYILYALDCGSTRRGLLREKSTMDHSLGVWEGNTTI